MTEVIDYDSMMPVNCDGCGADAYLEPAEHDGRILMLCDECFAVIDDD